ncbi:MAG TPA: NAD-dependent protein deacylase [Clostridiaceae bacterium]|nr:NAD-dependent protein deacylase [Clostridiaceae bacterium]
MSIQKLKEYISNSNNIVFLGGAGVSTESGIPDFRSESGIYKAINQFGYPPEYILSHTFFIKHPKEFFKFYKNNMIFPEAKPNNAHKALAELEKKGRLKAVITQNIDGLHQLAGSKNVLELHGSVHENYCMNCKENYDLDYIMNSKDTVPKCSKCGGIVRPNVTLYEEALDMDTLNSAVTYVRNADVFIVGGTSLAVYPAAGLVDYYRGNKLVLINKSSTPYDHYANLIINDSIGKVLSEVGIR